MNLTMLTKRIPDLRKIISYGLRVFFYMSPCLYPMSKTTGLHYEILTYNPYSYFVEWVRLVANLESEFHELDMRLFSVIVLCLMFFTIREFTPSIQTGGDVYMDIDGKNILDIRDLVIEYHGFERSWRYPFGTLTPFRALNGISLSAHEGETIGLIGRNGSGKTTLLRSIFGALRPLSGSVFTRGRVILLSGTDPGFIPLLTGRQNVGLLASVYGIEDERIEEFISDVEQFANIGDAFDRQFIGYSTGMRGKVGFGFMTGIDADLLLIDETLGVGDQEFRSKSKNDLTISFRDQGQ